MATRNPKEVFLMLLSDSRRNTERSAAIYREISEMAENPDVKEALEARAFIADKNLETLDECFEMIEEKPVKLNGRLQEVFVEDLREGLRKYNHRRRDISIFLPKPLTWLTSGSLSTQCSLPRLT